MDEPRAGARCRRPCSVRVPRFLGDPLQVGGAAGPDVGREDRARWPTISVVGCRILIVDDNEDLATVLSHVLEFHGYEVRTAGDGLAALASAAEFAPQAILLDLGLPQLDGFGVASRLRASGFHGPLIAMSGMNLRDVGERTIESGFDHHLTKPVDPGLILSLLPPI